MKNEKHDKNLLIKMNKRVKRKKWKSKRKMEKRWTKPEAPMKLNVIF